MTSAPDLGQAINAFESGDLERARAIAEQGLDSPASPKWQHLLGLIHCRLGDLSTGVEHLRAAAIAEPANAGFQVMLARALVDSGRADEVLEMPEPGPIASPADMALWNVRAEAAQSTGDHDRAASAWSRITMAAPRDWRAWGNLGNVLAAQKKWSSAADAFDRAAKLNPAEAKIRADAVAAYVQEGRHQQQRLRFEQAEIAFRRAYELDPADREAVRNLGMAFERTNQLDALAKLLDDALAAGIAKVELAYLWAVLAWRQQRVEEARELLDQVDPAQEPVAWTLRVKVADALGDSEGAFHAAVEMNRSAIEKAISAHGREEWERKARGYREEQRQLARTITPEWAANLQVLSDPPPQRLSFLVGFPRSGTTLLDTFLLGHPEVEVLEEKQLVGIAGKVAGPLEQLPSAGLQRLEKARQTYFERLRDLIDPDFAGIVIDKFPLDMGAAPLIHALFPDAPIIFAQRHPCDVVLSGFLQPFGVTNFSDITAAADYYDAMMTLWTASLEALPIKVQTVVYEELVDDPEAALKPIVSFLGLEWTDRILDHRRTARERGAIVTPSYDQVTEPVTKRPSGRWKRYREQLEPVLPILLPWAERLGYRE